MKKAKKPPFATAPKKSKGAAKELGKKATFGHAMGGAFGSVTPKKPEFDKPAPTRAVQNRQRSARMARLSGKLI